MSIDLVSAGTLKVLSVEQIRPNETNPRLDFPQDELDKLADSIDQEGILVPLVVYPHDDHFILVDGERRFRSALDLGLPEVPAIIVAERSERERLQQMFNIHLIREAWKEIPTARALVRLSKEIETQSGTAPSDSELSALTGLQVEQVKRLMYAVSLPPDWQEYIRNGQVPLNFFWELKKNVLDPLQNRRASLVAEFGLESIQTAFVEKRLAGSVTDTVSLRKVAPIIKFASEDAQKNGSDSSALDETLRDLITKPEVTIEDAYEATVEMMVEVDKLGRRTASILAIFHRLLSQDPNAHDRDTIHALGEDLQKGLADLLRRDLELNGQIGG